MSDPDKDTSSNWTPPSVAELQAMLPLYEVTALWGRGGMGAVYKGRQKSLHRDVAIKVLPENFGAGDRDSDPHQFVERFKLEARSMANLDHPAILSVYDFGQTEQGQLYLVMEFVDGMDIYAYLQHHGGKLPDKHAIAICSHVLDALQYAHDSGVIHRDIKPSNVLINSQGRVKLADFGLAKRIAEEGDDKEDSAAPLTMPNMAMGTPDYVAPETLDSSQEADGRADLYAVGVMLYELLTGKLPRGQFKTPSEMTPGLDVRFDAVVSKALQTDPNDRYASATAFRSDLDKILSQPIPQAEDPQSSAIPVAELAEAAAPASNAKPGTSKPEPTEPEKSKAPLWIGVGLAAVLLVVGVVAFLMNGGERGIVDPLTAGPIVSGQAASTIAEEGGAKRPAEPSQSETPSLVTSDAAGNSTAQQGRFALPSQAVGTAAAKLEETPKRPEPSNPEPIPEPKLSKPEPEPTTPDRPSNPTETPAPEQPTTPEEIPKSENEATLLASIPGLKERLEAYLTARRTAVEALATSYLKGLDTRMNQAADAGDLKLTKAYRGEKSVVEELQKALEETIEDPVEAVGQGATLPPLTDDVPDGLVSLRKIWEGERQKIRTDLDGKLQQSLKALESELTKTRELEKADAVLAYREGLGGKPEAPVATKAESPKPAPSAPTPATPANTAIGLRTAAQSATKEEPFENSLSMKFVPVPITGGPSDGKLILFSIWETRVEDFEEYVEDEIPGKWARFNDALFKQDDGHPAVSISWDEAVAFCEWLSKKEQRRRKIGPTEHYRLPTDHEWSCAVGIGDAEDANVLPIAKSAKIRRFSWGEDPTPPPNTGNFRGEETKENLTEAVGLPGYSDKFARTAPVGSFFANEAGLFDLDGNISEFCNDVLAPADPNERVYRGGSWYGSTESSYWVSTRGRATASRRYQAYGFRVVLDTGVPVIEGAPQAAAKPTWSPAVIQAALEKKPGRLYGFGKDSNGRNVTTLIAKAVGIDDFVSVEVSGGWNALRANGKVVGGKGEILEYSGRIAKLSKGYFHNLGAVIDSRKRVQFPPDYYLPPPSGVERELREVIDLVRTGGTSVMALTEEGKVIVWGEAYDLPGAKAPPVEGLTGVLSIGGSLEGCHLVRKDGTVIWWAAGGDRRPVPAEISDVVKVAGDGRNGIALTSAGQVKGYGNNEYRVLEIPENLGKCIDIRNGSAVVAAQREDGSWVAWGNQSVGLVDKINSLGPVTDLSFNQHHGKYGRVLWIKADVE